MFSYKVRVRVRGRSHMTSSPRGGGGFQMMTIDDEGEGVFGPMMTSSQKFNFLANFWDFTGYFTKIFPKIFKFRKKNSQVNLKLNQIVSDLLQDIVLINPQL